MADVNKGYWTTMAPLVVGNHVIIGVSGDLDNLPGYLRAVDPETAKRNGNGIAHRPPELQMPQPVA